MKSKTFSLRLTNTQKSSVTVHLEPWGEQHVMPCGATFDLIANSTEDGTLEIELSETDVTIYGWSGSIVSVAKSRVEESTENQLAA